MRMKRFICVVLMLIAITSCFGVSAAAAWTDDGRDASVATRASGKFSMEVAANKTVKAKTSFPLEVGEVVTIKASYSPFNASVDFGLIAPDGLFYGINTTTGVFDGAIRVNQRGYFYLAVRNNSSETIDVSGYVNY